MTAMKKPRPLTRLEVLQWRILIWSYRAVFVGLAVFVWVIHPWHKAAVGSAIALLILALVELWYARFAKRRGLTK